jgi:hypothetical protein
MVAAMFKSRETAGLGLESLVNAALSDVESGPVGKVARLDSRRIRSVAGQRGLRAGVEAETDKEEVVILGSRLQEVNEMARLSLISCQMSLNARIPSGGVPGQAPADLTKPVMVSLLDFKLTPERRAFHQALKPAYAKPPLCPPDDVYETHLIQLPLFEQIRPDPVNPLHCWLSALLRAHRANKLMGEAAAEDPILAGFRGADEGFAQIIDRRRKTASDPEERLRYEGWAIERALERGVNAPMNGGRAGNEP